MKQTAKGFTLIELVVAMVVAAILVAIAIPSYTTYVLKAHRTEAKAALLDLASLEERYFTTANIYSTLPSDLGYGTQTWPVTVGSGYYAVQTPTVVLAVAPTATTTGTPATFTLTAVAIGNQTKDTACYTFKVTSAGVRQALTQGGVDNSATCWN
jgi:type IV pilus assembly protein PilE